MSVQHVRKGNQKIVGLTGGIASGKSTASTYLKQQGLHVIDCDLIVKHLYLEDAKMIKEIYDAFGIEVRSSKDKKTLAKMIYEAPERRETLNQIIHPRVFASIEQTIKNNKNTSLFIIDMPLLFEVGYEKQCDETLLIYVPKSVQIERLIERDGITKAQAEQRIKAQMPMETKKEMASVVIDNQGTIESLYQQLKDYITGA